MNEVPKPKGRGCFFYGCLITVVVVVVGAIGTFIGVRYMIKKGVATYTDSAPVALPAEEVPAAQIAEVQKRSQAFFDGLASNKPLSPLVLSAEDLNALIAGTGTNGWKDKLRVQIVNDQIQAQASLPLDMLNIGMLRGRYLNGTVAVKVRFEDGVLNVSPESIMTKGKPLPAPVLANLRQQDLARNLASNPNVAALLQNLESLTVTNGAVTLQPKEPAGAPAP